MADLSNYLSALRSALQLGGVSPLPGDITERFFNYFRGPGSPAAPAAAPGRPASTETGAAPASAPAAPGPGRPMAPVPASSSEPMPLPPEPAAAGQPQSLLDRLRQSTAASLENPGLQAAGDIGAGMLASRSPNFFSMLGAGLQAQRAAERERRQDLRQAASTEAEDAYRRRSLELREQELNDPAVRALREAQAAYYRMGGVGGSRAGATGQLTPAVLARLRNDARSRAVTALRNNPSATPAEIDALAEQYFQEALMAAGGGGTPAPAAPQQNIPTINPAGRPTR